MTSKHQKYELLVDKDEQNYSTTSTTKGVPSSTLTNRTLILLLVISSLGHFLWPVIWISHLQYGLTKTCGPEKSPYAGLTYDVPIPFRDVSMFVHYNRVIADATWDSWVVEPGIVALPHDFVNGKMLPQAQSSPLDEDKGVYILSSYHSLHCLVSKINLTFNWLLTIYSNNFASHSPMPPLVSRGQMIGVGPLITIFIVSTSSARILFVMQMIPHDIQVSLRVRSREWCRHVCVETGIKWRNGRDLIQLASVIWGRMLKVFQFWIIPHCAPMVTYILLMEVQYLLGSPDQEFRSLETDKKILNIVLNGCLIERTVLK